MIAAVKVESSALDSMKEKLREVENLRNQISNFTKRLLDADQANLNLKSNLVKVQEMYAEARKAKAEVRHAVICNSQHQQLEQVQNPDFSPETANSLFPQVESSIVPLRAELNRTKDQCNKERMGRLAAQQLVAQMKDQIAMLENANENLSREVKTIPALTESNEILKNDLSQLRKRYKVRCSTRSALFLTAVRVSDLCRFCPLHFVRTILLRRRRRRRCRSTSRGWRPSRETSTPSRYAAAFVVFAPSHIRLW
jgi:chromosome segregation ATPase